MWDFACASQASITDECTMREGACPIPICGEPGSGSCCFPNATPYCNDEECCQTICLMDPSCCDVAWDSICAEAANDPFTGCDACGETFSCGDPEAGDCCELNSTPFCDDFNCCQLVCAFDELCCIGTWDEICVALAIQNCIDCAGGFAPPKAPIPPGK